MYSQVFLEGNPKEWWPVIRELVGGWLELLPPSFPNGLLPHLSWDPVVVGIIVYVQLGFLLLAYLHHSRVRDLRAQLLSLETRCESSLREQEAQLAVLRGGGTSPETAEIPSHNAVGESEEERAVLGSSLLAARKAPVEPPVSHLPIAAKRRKAVEMAEQGAGAFLIAETLHLRPAEVDLLLRIHLLERKGASHSA